MLHQRLLTIAQFRPLDVLRWQRAVVDVSNARSVDEALHQTAALVEELHQQADCCPLAIRVELTGSSRIHQRLLAERQRWVNEIRAHAIEAGGSAIWVEKIKIRTTVLRRSDDSGSAMEGPIGELTALIAELRSDPALLRKLGVDFSDIARNLPTELKVGAEGAAFDDPDWLRSILVEAESLLISRLLERGDGP